MTYIAKFYKQNYFYSILEDTILSNYTRRVDKYRPVDERLYIKKEQVKNYNKLNYTLEVEIKIT